MFSDDRLRKGVFRMEKKTIGGFIATLRKANGMTQRELAEQLNVSDKTVSRWERNDGAPDLALIPVIAEIFGVTCDELLRGERTPISQRRSEGISQEGKAEGDATDACVSAEAGTVTIGMEAIGAEITSCKDRTASFSIKGKKQCKRLLAVSYTKYKNQTFIAMGISFVGFLAAMIGNLGFLRCTIGFLAGAVFYLAGIVCQAVFLNGAYLAVADDELDTEAVGQYKRSVIRLAEVSIGLTLVLFAASLPLISFGLDTYSGLSAESWLQYGILCGVLMFLVYVVFCFFWNAYLLKKGAYSIGEKDREVYQSNHNLALKCTSFTLTGLFLTYVLQFVVTCGFSPYEMADGTQFYDYESFIAYMETPTPRNHFVGNGPLTTVVEETMAPEAITYYDRNGNVISKEEALKEQLHNVYDEVVCEYIRYNENVSSMSWRGGEDGSILPITVVTYDDVYKAKSQMHVINAGFVLIYAVEMMVACCVYFKQRRK